MRDAVLAMQQAGFPYREALAILFAQGGQRAQALDWAERWALLAPNDPQARQLIQRLGGRP